MTMTNYLNAAALDSESDRRATARLLARMGPHLPTPDAEDLGGWPVCEVGRVPGTDLIVVVSHDDFPLSLQDAIGCTSGLGAGWLGDSGYTGRKVEVVFDDNRAHPSTIAAHYSAVQDGTTDYLYPGPEWEVVTQEMADEDEDLFEFIGYVRRWETRDPYTCRDLPRDACRYVYADPENTDDFTFPSALDWLAFRARFGWTSLTHQYSQSGDTMLVWWDRRADDAGGDAHDHPDEHPCVETIQRWMDNDCYGFVVHHVRDLMQRDSDCLEPDEEQEIEWLNLNRDTPDADPEDSCGGYYDLPDSVLECAISEQRP